MLVVTELTLADYVEHLPTLPVLSVRVSAGKPVAVDTAPEHLPRLDFHDVVGAWHEDCYLLRVEGESMTGAGIQDGDVLVVDRRAVPASGTVVVACVDGGLTVKRFVQRRKGPGGRLRSMLLAENPAYPSIDVTDDEDAFIWGVVTFSFHDHRYGRLGLPPHSGDGA
jgi:DNA polymerase V